MKIFRSKGYACEKQFSIDNLPSRPYPSTTSIGESRRVSLAGWTSLFTHPYTCVNEHVWVSPFELIEGLASLASPGLDEIPLIKRGRLPSAVMHLCLLLKYRADPTSCWYVYADTLLTCPKRAD